VKKPPEVVDVPISRQDIEAGRVNSVLTCPIALCCNRLDSRHQWAVGVLVAARMHKDESVDYYSLAVDAQDFRHAFDRGEDVEPQTVHLYLSPKARILLYGDAS
jgi:hypothetical protein